jgi:hypothetical protein
MPKYIHHFSSASLRVHPISMPIFIVILLPTPFSHQDEPHIRLNLRQRLDATFSISARLFLSLHLAVPGSDIFYLTV